MFSITFAMLLARLLRCACSVAVQMTECAVPAGLPPEGQGLLLYIRFESYSSLNIAQFGCFSVLGKCDVKLGLTFMHSSLFAMQHQHALSCCA